MWRPQGFFQATGSVDNLAWSSGELVGHFEDPSFYFDFSFVNPNFTSASDTTQMPTLLWQAPDLPVIWPAWWDGSGEALSAGWANFDDGEVRPGFGANIGGSIEIAGSAKRAAAQGFGRGGGAQPSTAAKRAVSAGFSSAGGVSFDLLGKAGVFTGISASGGSVLALGQKQSTAVVFSAASKGGGSQASVIARFITGMARITTGGRQSGALAKIAALLGRIAGGGADRALTGRISLSTVILAAGGQVSVTGSKRTGFGAASIGGAAETAAGLKVSIGAAKSAGGGGQIVDLRLPGTPDVVLIAGRWIVAAAITGVVPGAVTVAALKDALALSGKSAPVITLDGKPARSAEIEGTRKRT